ncbi:MAG: Asp-tRNA(Asn)/Glu-tRNA(Gln) amidotransferase subunit GatB [Planctomycetes bacterium]|nr:Asp-tRNA(Asn)/Glu-tRNA(Gln) amidotransferase subunit GatB [Planctomycetota bacterium]
MEYEIVIGLETHAELSTETKLFCGCSTKFGAEPNTQVCPICLGMPGVLPVMNKKAFEYALKAALALNCEIKQFTNFDRKGYYYPDLPKNYQISQNYLNLGTNGYIDLRINPPQADKKRVSIHNVHLEEEAGKLIHPETTGADFSLVDFNRAGVPLLEIVSNPDMRSLDEVESYMETLRNVLLYIEVSDCKMQEGSLRFEASVSLRKKGEERLGHRVEIKNLNSMKAVLKVLDFEIKRQTELLNSGSVVERETRLWDDVLERSERMRSKEEAHDYRYFPEPDLVPVLIDAAWIAEIKRTIPELPVARYERFVEEYCLSNYDARVLTDEKAVADYFEQCVKIYNSPKTISNWITNDVLRERKEKGFDIYSFVVTPARLVELVKMVDEGKVNLLTAREIFAEMIETGQTANRIVEEKGLIQISDERVIEEVVKRVVESNPNTVADYRRGKKNAFGFLIGQIMRETKGKANPRVVSEILRTFLDRVVDNEVLPR